MTDCATKDLFDWLATYNSVIFTVENQANSALKYLVYIRKGQSPVRLTQIDLIVKPKMGCKILTVILSWFYVLIIW